MTNRSRTVAKTVTVYPCACPDGHYLRDRPRVPTEVPIDEAVWLVATKAFSYDPDGLHARTESHDSAVWPPVPAGPATEPESPAASEG